MGMLCNLPVQQAPVTYTILHPSLTRDLGAESITQPLRQESLSGNSKTVMIAALSPALSNFDETLSTLKFARASAGPA